MSAYMHSNSFLPLLTRMQIGIVVNLQEPGEHALCADGIDDAIGFSYNPEHFQAAGIATFNWYWEDLTCPNNETVLVICQNMSRFDKMGKKIFVHCHAGTGRTGLVIASFLYYSGMVKDGATAVNKVKTQRPGSLKKKSQAQFVLDFCNWLDYKRKSFFPKVEFADDGSTSELTYAKTMSDNLQLIHGRDSEDFKFFPKFLGLCLNKLQTLPKLTVDQFLEKNRISKSMSTDNQHTLRKVKGMQPELWVDDWT